MSDINAYPIYVQMELDMLKHKYGLDTPAYKEGEGTIVYEYLKTCRKPQTCSQCAEALGLSPQKTSALLRQLSEDYKILRSLNQRRQVRYEIPKAEKNRKKKVTKKAELPSCEFPVRNYSGIMLAAGLVIILGFCIYFGI